MKQFYTTTILSLFIGTTLCFNASVYGQVGVNSNNPKGLLDLGDTSNMGIVYPNVSLTDVYVETITNPRGGTLAAGTCVYNTNTAGTGEDSVYPGIYIWTGSKWIPQFNKKDNQLAMQDTNLRTGSNNLTNGTLGNQTISFDTAFFTPKFSGPYKIILTLHYGAGKPNDPSGSQYVNYAAGAGEFDFTFNGTTTSYIMKSYSGINNDRLFKGGSGSSALEFVNQMNQSVFILEESLTRNVVYPFSLTFNQETLEGFEGNGDISASPAGDGRGYIVSIGNYICEVELSYVGE